MTDFFKYLRVRLLKAVKLYPVIICFTLILAVGIAVVFGNILTDRSESEEKTKFQIGLVGNTSDSYLGIGVFAVTNFDVSKEYAEFIEMTEDTAQKKLKNDEIIGYVSIPDGFVESVIRGENIDIKFITKNKPALLGTLLVEEICSVVSDLVVSSQNGIYGFSDFADELTYSERAELIDRINIEYLACVFDRDTAYEVTTLGYAEDLSFEVYYVCAFTVILMLLWGICCSNLMVKSSYALSRSLIFSGRGVASQILAEFLPFFLILFCNILLLLSMLGICVEFDLFQIPFISSADSFAGCVSLAFAMIPAILLICAMQFLFYELSGGIISAVVLQVLSTVALSYISGFILPLYSLPSLLQNISGSLPTVVGFNYIAALLKDGMGVGMFLQVIAYIIVLLAASVLIRRFRVRSDRYA